MLNKKTKTGGITRIGPSKPVGKEWADKIRKLQEEKTKKKIKK